MKIKPVFLIILDGFGYRAQTEFNAIAQANTPHLKDWFAHYPHTLLKASGDAVGLPDGSMGNSEVGHETIGAGRIIEQPESFLLRAIGDGSFFENPMLKTQLRALKDSGKAIHIIGLLSDAGVHCHEKIIYAFIKAAADAGISRIFVHPILDGRDAPPKSAVIYLQRLEKLLKTVPMARIGSLHGRFYAMDRDSNWDRTKLSYEVLTKMPTPVRPERAKDTNGKTWQSVLEQNYAQDITDEFIPPTNLDPEAIVLDGDGIIFANYRADRARQLTECFTNLNKVPFVPTTSIRAFSSAVYAGTGPSLPARCLSAIALATVESSQSEVGLLTPVSYGSQIHTQVMYPQPPVTNTLKEILSAHGKTIFTIAESEKYAHVTYFFDGGRETQFPGETRVLLPSINTRNYIATPEMSAPEITAAVIKSLHTNPCDFYLINYANADMVGHSGDFEATKKAIEILDQELDKLFEVVVKEMHGTMFITGDHGNAEDKFDIVSNQVRTSHTTNPVPFLVLDESKKNEAVKLPLNQLADIMGFVLGWMGVKN